MTLLTFRNFWVRVILRFIIAFYVTFRFDLNIKNSRGCLPFKHQKNLPVTEIIQEV